MTWWLLKPLGEFLSGCWARLSILRLDYLYSAVFHRPQRSTDLRCTQLSFYVLGLQEKTLVFRRRMQQCKFIYLFFLISTSSGSVGRPRKMGPLQFRSPVLLPPGAAWTRRCGAALLACRSADAPITHKSLTQDRSERFHLCRWVTPQSLVTGLALAN